MDRENYLSDLGEREFADRLAERWGELSAIHPFRDGNTRSQVVYITALASRAGHAIDWERVDVDALRAHRLNAVAGHDRPLADYLAARLITPEHTAPSSALDPELQRIAGLQRLDYPTSASDIRPPAGGRAEPGRNTPFPRQQEGPNHGYGR